MTGQFRVLGLRVPAGAFVAVAAAVAVLGVPSALVHAQSVPVTPLARAQAVAQGGDSAKARTVVDSILADTDPDAPTYADALYWRGVLAAAPDDRRKDLLRVVVDYPLSPRLGDALYALAQAENAAGERQAAERHLARLVRDNAASDVGAKGAFELGRLLMADGDVRPACAALDSAYAYEPLANVEVRNQIAYAKRPCERLRDLGQDTAAVRRDSTKSNTGRGSAPARGAVTGRGASPKRGQPAGRGAPASGSESARWSVQVAAFANRADAVTLAAHLKTAGYDSRVTPEKPYRVRVGHYATRATATAVADKLKADKTTAIVVEAERP